MAGVEDVAVVKMVRRELNRRKIDCALVDVRVSHGVVFLRGVAKPMRGGATDVKGEIEIVCRVLRQKAEIRDVIAELIYRT
jgi:hypothetical protein